MTVTVTLPGEVTTTQPMVTILGAVIDRSSSMSMKTEETIAGYNTWLADQKNGPDKAYLVRTLFSEVYTVDEAIPVDDAQPLNRNTYIPQGYTALRDAVASTIQAMVKAGVGYPSVRYLLNVLTDGMENASREISHGELVNLIAEKTAAGNWTFAFQGAGPGAWNQASSLGIGAGNFMAYANTPQGTVEAFAAHSASTRAYRGGGQSVSSSFYDPDDTGGPTAAPGGQTGAIVNNQNSQIVGGFVRPKRTRKSPTIK